MHAWASENVLCGYVCVLRSMCVACLCLCSVCAWVVLYLLCTYVRVVCECRCMLCVSCRVYVYTHSAHTTNHTTYTGVVATPPPLE